MSPDQLSRTGPVGKPGLAPLAPDRVIRRLVVSLTLFSQVAGTSALAADGHRREALVGHAMESLKVVGEINVGSPIGQCRAVPVELGPGKPRAVLAVYCADAGVDPWSEMFFYPTDTLKMLVFDERGKIHWRLELGRGQGLSPGRITVGKVHINRRDRKSKPQKSTKNQ